MEGYPNTYTLRRGLRPQWRQRERTHWMAENSAGFPQSPHQPQCAGAGLTGGGRRSNLGGPILCPLKFLAARALPRRELQKAGGPQMLEKAALCVPLPLDKPSLESVRREGSLPSSLANEPRETGRKPPSSCRPPALSLQHLRLPSNQLTKKIYYGGQCLSAR